MNWDSWGGGGSGLVMVVFMVVFLALIVIGIVLVIRASAGSNGGVRTPETNRALEVLETRFAKGEIDQEEFEERRRILKDPR